MVLWSLLKQMPTVTDVILYSLECDSDTHEHYVQDTCNRVNENVVLCSQLQEDLQIYFALALRRKEQEHETRKVCEQWVVAEQHKNSI
jgi:hypothetical protein